MEGRGGGAPRTLFRFGFGGRARGRFRHRSHAPLSPLLHPPLPPAGGSLPRVCPVRHPTCPVRGRYRVRAPLPHPAPCGAPCGVPRGTGFRRHKRSACAHPGASSVRARLGALLMDACAREGGAPKRPPAAATSGVPSPQKICLREVEFARCGVGVVWNRAVKALVSPVHASWARVGVICHLWCVVAVYGLSVCFVSRARVVVGLLALWCVSVCRWVCCRLWRPMPVFRVP